jgi:hypothetical protein
LVAVRSWTYANSPLSSLHFLKCTFGRYGFWRICDIARHKNDGSFHNGS